MNELQISLLVIGAIVIFAVLAFNRWQERKYRRQSEQNFPSPHDDVLLKTEASPVRVEPVLDAVHVDEEIHSFEPEMAADEVDSADWHEESSDAASPVIADTVEEAEPEPEAEEKSTQAAQPATTPGVAHAAQVTDAAPDPSTEFIATLSAGDPISAHALVLVLQQLKSVGKPLRWLGQRHQHTDWEEVSQSAPSTEFVKLAACMQLSDRNGPARSEEVNAFCEMAQAVAANLYAVIECPDKQSALEAAIDLDQFCADVDVLIGFNVISKDGAPFAGTKLRGLAESAGMKLMPDGSFHYLNDHGAQLFSLVNLETAPFAAEAMKHLSTHGVTFLFDVPKAAGGIQAFNQMLLAARQFIGPLGALLVDDNRRELTDSGIDKIRQQLLAIYHKMEQRDTPPGSARSKRLFA